MLLCAWVARVFVGHLREAPPRLSVCMHDAGQLHTASDDQALFNSCLRAQADVFIKSDYVEMKDLAKSFLTLLTAILVASITFSEKIVDLGRAGTWARSLIITSWVAFLVAIVSLGAGLSFMTLGAGCATYQPYLQYQIFEAKAIPLYITSGIAFGTGLASMLISGVVAMLHRAAVVERQAGPRPAYDSAINPS
jgi:hypothetical protein